MKTTRKYLTLAEQPDRFWKRVRVAATDECWEWSGCCNNQGYGRAGKTGYAHRLAFVLSHGPVPTGMIVMHTCDNRKCCNPRHLVAGTQAENMQDAARKGRIKGGPNPRPLDVALAVRRIESGESLRSVARSLGFSHRQLARRIRKGKP